MDERYRNTSKIWDQINELYQDSLSLHIFDESLEFLILSCQNQNPSILDMGIRPVNMSKYLCTKLPSARLSVANLPSNMESFVDRSVPYRKNEQIDFKQPTEFEGEFDIIINGFGIPILDEENIAQFISTAYGDLCVHGLLYLTYQDDAEQNQNKELDLLQDQLYSKDFIFNLLDQAGFRRLKHFPVLHTLKGTLIAKYEVLIARKLVV